MNIINRDLSPGERRHPWIRRAPGPQSTWPRRADRAPPLWGYRKYEGQRL